MVTRETRRAAAIERMADHVLAHGLAGASLRPLAAAAGTSDRMLLYYFADKEELLAATLGAVASRLTAMLDAALPAGARLPYGALLAAVWTAVGSPALRPYMRLWLELAAAAASGLQPHRGVAAAIMDGFVDWAGSHLDDPDPAAVAGLLATLEGCLFLDAVGRRDLADAAAARGDVSAAAR